MGAETWVVDSVHSSAEFAVSHMAISTYRGRFRQMAGKVVIDEEHPSKSSIEATVAVKSVDIEPGGLFDKLMGDEFFWVDKHPNLQFQSTQVERVDGTHWKVQGNLSIRGVSRPVELTVEDKGGGNNPFARKPMRSFHAHGELDRGEWGMKWNFPLDTGAKYLGEKVAIDLFIEVLKQG